MKRNRITALVLTAALALFLVLSVIGTAVALTGVEKTEA